MATKHATDLEWWQTRRFVVAMALLAAVPLLWPDIPPLVDLPGHMGRYRVQLDLYRYPWLTDWYDFKWSLIGNLGIDILVQIFAPVLGLELTVKLIVMAIPPLIVVGLLWIAREVHGRIPATALFALPLAYCFPFQFGFVNFMLSMALALPMFAFWLRLGRLGKFRLRAALFVPLSCALWICHTFGWGVLGVLAFSAEMVREHDRAKETVEHRFNPVTSAGLKRWAIAWFRGGLHCLPLALPMLLMVAWRSGQHVTGQTADWFNWQAKFAWLTMMLRDRWISFDVGSGALLGLILCQSFRDPNIEYSRNLGLSTLFLVAVFVLLPRIVFGSAYADMRLAPFMVAIALIAIRPRPLPGDARWLALKHPGLDDRRLKAMLAANRRRTMQWFATFGLVFVIARTAGTTVSYVLFDQVYDRQLKALDHIPQGARLISFVGQNCVADWKMTRLEHMPALALERKEAYTNDQWSMAGAQLLTTKYAPARPFAHDPSQITTLTQCPREYWRPIDRSLARFPRAAFDYVWLINPPPYDPKYTEDLTPIWRDGISAVFKVNHVDVAPVTKNGDFPLPPRGKTPLY
ncbi:hypothetical protein [Sphingomonas sp.]|jgi:hypothetical protein|uniref:hypothetical protein n=1 Tax=Sphingomonas sp. TaxID=28214 RepID=UPI002E31DF71|nr:hypothetical protein [Sphingomonas sp.]HEX4695025.1 hypothetical protein [Sphingomonas sp.]